MLLFMISDSLVIQIPNYEISLDRSVHQTSQLVKSCIAADIIALLLSFLELLTFVILITSSTYSIAHFFTEYYD